MLLVDYYFGSYHSYALAEVFAAGVVCNGTPKMSRASKIGFTPQKLVLPTLTITESSPSPRRPQQTPVSKEILAQAMMEEQARVIADRLWRRASSEAVDAVAAQRVLALTEAHIVVDQPTVSYSASWPHASACGTWLVLMLMPCCRPTQTSLSPMSHKLHRRAATVSASWKCSNLLSRFACKQTLESLSHVHSSLIYNLPSSPAVLI